MELGDATSEASRDMGAATKLLAEEIRDGFKKYEYPSMTWPYGSI